MISVKLISSLSSIWRLISSAALKSTRQCLATVSVRLSPAMGIIPYATMAPSFVIEISEVPAPTSTSAMLSIRNFSGIAT